MLCVLRGIRMLGDLRGMLGVFRARGKFGIQYTFKNVPVAPCRPKIISHRLKSIQQHQKSSIKMLFCQFLCIDAQPKMGSTYFYNYITLTFNSFCGCLGALKVLLKCFSS